jgi:hypothetical protein
MISYFNWEGEPPGEPAFVLIMKYKEAHQEDRSPGGCSLSRRRFALRIKDSLSNLSEYI